MSIIDRALKSFEEVKNARFHVVLVQPKIPQNTGSIARLCAGTEAILHLVKPYPFSFEDKHLKRAGLDYWPHVKLVIHESWQSYYQLTKDFKQVLFSTHAEKSLFDTEFTSPVFLVFGSETAGLKEVIDIKEPPFPLVKLPMTGEIRSLNLAQSAAVGLYEAIRRSS